MAETASHERTVLPAFTFTTRAVADQVGVDAGLTEKILNALAFLTAAVTRVSSLSVTSTSPMPIR